MRKVKLGLEKILAEEIGQLADLRVGLICNQASVDHSYRHAADLFFENAKINLIKLFGPQHGIRGDVQDNMVETGHSADKITKLPVYSLYSETREPTREMLQDLDALVFDLQDVGCRVYTFIYTMANAMRAAAGAGKKFFVLDRPNPIGGATIEGNILEKGHESFVGQFPIPMRHGLTVGELAQFFNLEFKLGCDLTVIRMDGWRRECFHDETDAPWAMPSPNMPTIESAVVFSGTVFFEGTQISEGRGTTRPFEIVGAPFIDAREYADALVSLRLSGVIFRPISFLPTFQKFKNESCEGVALHVLDRAAFEPVITGIAMVKTAFELYGDEFRWKTPPYEYEHERNPFDVIAGTKLIREQIETGAKLDEIKSSWTEGLEQFRQTKSRYHLY